ncbi:MAG: hypothetical protein WD080_06560 [Egibacteraceae bacterium]
MSDVHTNPNDKPVTGTPRADQRDEYTLRIPKPGGGGPVRGAIKTTEFWMTIALVLLVLLAAYVGGDSLERVDGWRFATWAVMAYVISRGLAKLGNRADASHDLEPARHR